MNELKRPTHSYWPDERDWSAADDLIRAIANEAVLSNHPIPDERLESFPAESRDRQTLFSAIRGNIQPRQTGRLSLVERWDIEQSQIHWMTALNARLNAIRSVPAEIWNNVQPFFASMQETIDVLSQRMIPAPVHRGPAAVREQIYQPRRRALEPADLPALPALFCTALDPDADPLDVSGLARGVSHRLTLVCVQNPSLRHEETLPASEDGSMKLDLPHGIASLQKQGNDFCEFVWFLSEEAPNGSWTSGLVWLESKATRKLAADAVRLLRESAEKDRSDASCIDALFEINLLSTREFYTRAYEMAREGLLFMPRARRQENSAPFKESLWLFVNHLVDKILARLEKAEPVFRSIQRDWNAVASLRRLKDRLKEWE